MVPAQTLHVSEARRYAAWILPRSTFFGRKQL